MSYCRWSCMDFRCDLYCYESVYECWTIHVAKYRRVGDIPHLDYGLLAAGKTEEFLDQHKVQSAALDLCTLEEITLPHVGGTFHEPDLESFKERLLALRELGYLFPDYVLDDIDAEMRDNA